MLLPLIEQYVVYNEEQIDAKAINSSIYYYFQIGLDQHPTSILSKLLSHIIAEPAFDELRTKQQLGVRFYFSFFSTGS